jgi:hypothetical protein
LRKDKGFKPYHMHGEYAKHSYEECRANPRNRTDKARDNNNNKHGRPRHESHYHHDACYASSNKELHGSHHTPMPSDGEVASATSDGSKSVKENFHLERTSPKKRKLTKVAIKSHKGNPAKSSKKASDDQLSWDEVFETLILLISRWHPMQTSKLGLKLNLGLRTRSHLAIDASR